jgi:hypothetical protein
LQWRLEAIFANLEIRRIFLKNHQKYIKRKDSKKVLAGGQNLEFFIFNFFIQGGFNAATLPKWMVGVEDTCRRCAMARAQIRPTLSLPPNPSG